MINPAGRSASTFGRQSTASREIQLFEPPADAVCTIETTSRIVDIPRRTILIYCKYELISPAPDTAKRGYYFDRNAIRALRRIESLREICGDDFAGIKIILDLTAALERLRSDLQLLSRSKNSGALTKKLREASSISSERGNVKSNSRRKRK